MTLRLRLVLGVVVLVLVGLALFGSATYSLYSRSQYQRLDDQLRSSVVFVTGQVEEAAGITDSGPRHGPGSGEGPGRQDGGEPGPPTIVSLGTYAELRGRSGTPLASLQLTNSTNRPRLPTALSVGAGGARFLTTGSASGSGQWRVYVAPAPGPGGNSVVVAVPTREVTNSLHRLVLIETSAALIVLAIVSGGVWLMLRRGLRPLERMAGTAGSIAAGDLTQRVSPAGGPTEVGQLGLALNTMLDEIEAAFKERDETEQRLRQFLADASHELRTPLTSIQGFTELFRIGADRDHVDLATILRRVEQESERMKILVEDLLLLARLDQTRPIERSPVDLTVLAADACSDAVAAAPERAVTLRAPEPVVVLGDQAHLRQAIGNLVTNALRHTPEGTPIDVAASRDGDVATVSVRDHGPGLDDEAQAHVFDRFWQADKARVGTGAGLGLSIVAGIAAEHGGSASGANADGGGAIFAVSLPANGVD